MYLSTQMYEAIGDLFGVNSISPIDFYQRFLSWIRSPPTDDSAVHAEVPTNGATVSTPPSNDPDKLRAAMVRTLIEEGTILSGDVAAAFAAVPRHLFVPGEALWRAYDPQLALLPKTAANGTDTSVVSAAEVQAAMLEQAQVERGMNVLEVGSGGYNAALLAELVGPSGQVTSVDIDSGITARAGACLHKTGYDQVRVITADATKLLPGQSPFDRIIVTTAACDIAPAWIDELTPFGRIVVPLRFAGITRVIAFDRNRGSRALFAHSYRLGSFVTMQGCAEERLIPLTRDVALRVDSQHTPEFHLPALRHAIHEPPIEQWAGTAHDLPDELQLFLLTNAQPQMPILQASQELVDQGVFPTSARYGVPVLIDGGSFAYRTSRPNPDIITGYETGVVAHGPAAAKVADTLLALIREWANNHFKRDAARIEYHPKTMDTSDLLGWRVITQNGVLTVSWP
ncbi:protein-L-isoaspartate(D-aspartate) O-methyltransferase [Actinoplanes lutulentus]|nr:methyltransferase, FxLD system [Actinoplanes lutulentus]MBB2943274.1 protein-L-isoaspartate(D-aspartate) O-methyltransferase [Actinoplanes lutulentus]